jgi:hypothetical protein
LARLFGKAVWSRLFGQGCLVKVLFGKTLGRRMLGFAPESGPMTDGGLFAPCCNESIAARRQGA